jgi:hypothetical protein
MGADFIRKAAKSHKKRWDEGRKELRTADLFTREPTYVPRTVPFELTAVVELSIGDIVIVEAQGARLIARQRLSEVARAENPPRELLLAVQQSCGVAKGTIEQVHGVARVAEISLC